MRVVYSTFIKRRKTGCRVLKHFGRLQHPAEAFLRHDKRTDAMARILKLSSTPMNGASEEDRGVVTSCVDAFRRGGVVAVPTDTIYGLAASAESRAAIQKLYSIKGRKQEKPLAICVHSVESIEKWAVNTVSHELLSALLPGAVTVVLERKDTLCPDLNPNKGTIGIRVPDHPFLLSLAEALGGPIALTSANVSNERSTLSVGEFEHLWPVLDVVVDGGRIGAESEVTLRSGSTVVDLSVPGFYSIIREGCAFSRTVDVLRKHGLQSQLIVS